jgi:large subunit ribosomal protein L25
MKSLTIKGFKRESVGKSATKALRNAGNVPCVLYGEGEPMHFAADERAFKKLVYTPETHTVVIELEDGSKHEAIMQDIQFHPISDKILHVDFFRLAKDKEVTVSVPVKIEGVAPGIIKGGSLSMVLKKLKVRAIPANLPDAVTVNVDKLDIGNKVYVSELRTDSYKLVHPDNVVVVQVKMSRAAMKASSEEAAAEVATETTETGE